MYYRVYVLIHAAHAAVANMAAARSSKEQWAGFLRRLVQDGETAKITPRSAFAALQQKFCGRL